jgi:cell division protein FtsB
LETSDIRDELLSELSPRPVFRLRHFTVLGAIVLFGCYIYYLLYGNNSLLRLLALKNEQIAMEIKIAKLTEENAELRRELYELKLIFGEP